MNAEGQISEMTMMQLTVALPAGTSFDPGPWAQPCKNWGEYLEKERARIAADPSRVATLKLTPGGNLALFVNRVAFDE